MSKFLYVLNRHYLAIVLPLCVLYFLFLLFIRIQYNVDFADELLVLYVFPIIYAAHQFTKRIYIAVLALTGVLAHLLIYFITSNFVEGSIIIFICLTLYVIASELLFQSNKRVKETTKQLQITLQSIGEAVISTDSFGNVKYMNPIAEKLTGFNLSKIQDLPLIQYLNINEAENQNRISDLLQHVIQQKSGNCLEKPLDFIANNDEKKSAFCSASPIITENDSCDGVVLVFHEVTEEIFLRQQINDREAELRQIFNTLPEAAVYTDTTRNIVDVNHAFVQIFGYRKEEVIGKSTKILYANPEQYEEQGRKRYNPDRDDDYLPSEIEYRKKNGETFPSETVGTHVTDSMGNHIGNIGLFRDITEKKRTEQALVKNEQMYRQAIEVADAVPYYQNYLTNQYDFVGEGIQQLTGYTTKEFTYELWQSLEEELILLKDLENLSVTDAVNIAKSNEGVSWRADYKIRKRNGEHRWLSNAAIQVKNDQGDTIGSLGILQDITDRKHAEEALKRSERRFRRYFELGLVGMAITSLEKGWIEINDKLCEMFGYTRDELRNLTWSELTYADDLEKDVKQFNRVIDGEIDGYTLEKRFVHKDGSIIFSELSVKAMRSSNNEFEYLLALIHDITKNKQAEQELKQSDEKLKNLIDSTQAVFWQFDIKTQCFTYMSEQIEQLLGYPASSWTDMEVWANRIHKDDRNNSVRYCETQTTAGVNHEFEYRMFSQDHQEVWIRDTVTVILENKKPVSLIGFFFDITNQKRAELELQNIDKLKSIGTLAGGIAHDFNNILTGVYGNLSVAQFELNPKEPAYEFIQDAIHSLNRAKRLTKQLLTFSKGGAPVKEPVNLQELVEDIVRFDLSGSNVKPIFHAEDNVFLAEVDKGQIQQVFSNLVINANQATPNGGQLIIDFKRFSNHSHQMPFLECNDYIQITVQDNGTGIDPKYMDKIFEPFFTTKTTGTGIGLATVFSIINRHNGYIQVQSELGKGTTFTIYLPAFDIDVDVEDQTETSSISPSSLAGKILIMDDEEAIRKLLTATLSKVGLEVEAVSDGSEAVEKYQSAFEENQPYNVVILDITIPGGMGGEETIKGILQIDPYAKCIVSSGYANDPVMANYRDYGFKAVVPKPYTLTELHTTIDKVMNESLEQ